MSDISDFNDRIFSIEKNLKDILLAMDGLTTEMNGSFEVINDNFNAIRENFKSVHSKIDSLHKDSTKEFGG